METAATTNNRAQGNLVRLRRKATELTAISEDEEMLAEIVAMLSGKRLPCTYTEREFASVLQEADADHAAKRYMSHENLFAQYGL